MRILVTGAAGFIGSNLVRHLLATSDDHVTGLDALTYSGTYENLRDLEADPRFTFVHGDVCDRAAVSAAVAGHHAVMHLAAETHVDRSLIGPDVFVHTNCTGTNVVCDEARLAGVERFLHVSTDEVYGSIEVGAFPEDAALAPSSPYAASKAGSDLIALSHHVSHGLPVVVTRSSNQYGPRQFPEKLIPVMILNALEGKPLPVYGDGKNVRDWLYVDDHCAALALVADKGVPGETYAIGGRNEWTNIDIVRTICAVLDELHPDPGGPRERLITYVKDRPGHDRRYAIDPSKIARELGFSPAIEFGAGIRKTVAWYLENHAWCERIQSGGYRRERLGLSTTGGAS